MITNFFINGHLKLNDYIDIINIMLLCARIA